jgi:hypothetical protein
MEWLIDVPPPSRVVVSEEEAPKGTKREHPAAYAPCSSCGVMVLTGMTDTGEAVMLDTHQRTYVALWLNHAPQPQLRASAGYPVHRCLPQPSVGKEDR